MTKVIPLLEEKLDVTSQEAITGRVRVDVTTDTIEEVIHRELKGMRADVTRVPIDRVLDQGEPPPQPRNEGDVMVIPIFEEILVVEKRLVFKEELHIRQQTTVETVQIPVTLRKQRVVIERTHQDGDAAS